MAGILILYSTTDGHTLKICLRLKQVLEALGDRVTLAPVDDGKTVDMQLFDKVVIGASIRYGRHRPEVYRLVRENLAVLESRPTAFFTVNVVARKPEKCEPETNPYLRAFLKAVPWRPALLGVFAGKIDYRKYRYWDRQIIRLIMWITRGPTDPETNVEFTDWTRVDAFGRRIHGM